MTLPALASSKLFINSLKVAGPAFFMGMQATSLKTALSIIADRSVKSLSPLPFISLLVNCVIWSFYGLLRNDATVLFPNACGIVTGSICIGTYQKYSLSIPSEMYLISTALIGFAVWCYSINDFQTLGTLGCALAVLVMASPLATLTTVIKQKSTASLPFGTSLAGMLLSY